MLKSLSILKGIILLNVVFIAGCTILNRPAVTLFTRVVPRYGKIEISFNKMGKYEKPLDPACVTLDARLISPSGKTIIVPGFAMHETEPVKGLDETRKDRIMYKPVGPWLWKIRYSPDETGTYEGVVIVTTPNEIKKSKSFTFDVVESDNKGMIRVAKNNPYAFEYDNGEPYIPIGSNMCWANKDNRVEEYRIWLDNLAKNGGNYIRIWLNAPWCFGLEGHRPYEYNEDAASVFDSVVAMCEERNIAIKFCLGGGSSQFIEREGETTQRSFAPYRRSNGGPCATEEDFLLNPEAKKQWKAFERYVAARWGASSSVFAWEMWNEMSYFKSQWENTVTWTEEMCAYLKKIDPHQHLTGNSQGSEDARVEVWNNPSVDWANYHDYGGERHKDMTQYEIYAEPIKKLRACGKPVLLGECGLVEEDWSEYRATSAFRYPDAPKDTKGYAFHEALWIGFFAGGAGTGMHWWWDSMIHPFDYYSQYRCFANFVNDIPLNREPFPPVEATVKPANLRCYTRSASWGTIAWIVNRNDYWRPLVWEGKNPETVKDAIFVLPALEEGSYIVRFFNPWTGNYIGERTLVSDGKQLTIAIPLFKIDMAIKILKEGVGSGTMGHL